MITEPAAAPTTLASVLAGHRALVCVGTGGVGKTTVAAALALAGALAGRRAMVLTIDPARQLARSLGLASLRRGGEQVSPAALAAAGLAPPGTLSAGMLDQKGAWDAFISRHAPSPEVRDTLLANAFYQQLSTSFAGSTEYMAVEELCRLDESRAYDLIVIDTPPAGHAVDFLRAPERIERLLDPQVASWLSLPYRGSGSGPWRAMSASVRFVLHQLERALGTRALREVSAFFVALDALFGDVAGRAARARALLYGPQTAFVLIASPKERALTDGDELAATMRGLGVPLRATVINRVHPVPVAGVTPADLEQALADLAAAGAELTVVGWLRDIARDALATAQAERVRLDRFAARMPAETVWVEVPELDHDAHSLRDLAELAGRLGSSAVAPRRVTAGSTT
jgi:anion-transporting  ArsA/GET3 family ATPase